MSARRIIITAAGAGIGREIATRFADEGAQVHVCDVDQQGLDHFRSQHPDISPARVDVADEAAVDAWLRNALSELGGCDVLVNNAGISGPTAAVEEMTLDTWRQCLAINLDAQMLTCRRVVPVMKAQRSGCIINMSSTAGLFGCPFRTPYAAAKWAVIGFTKSVAAEAGPFNIRCNAICPGSVDGDRMDRVIAAEAAKTGKSQDKVRAEYASGTSLRRFAKASEIADLCQYLASDAAKFISGQAISVDGHTETYHSE
jgi:NAD(P)-dependent dehydrogenase (short-subunit alcohol dehydrogenase family)